MIIYKGTLREGYSHYIWIDLLTKLVSKELLNAWLTCLNRLNQSLQGVRVLTRVKPYQFTNHDQVNYL
jgi:hypothetical protein